MTRTTIENAAKFVVIGLTLVTLGAYTSADAEKSLMRLESRLEEIARDAASAKVDAATVLHMAVEQEKASMK